MVDAILSNLGLVNEEMGLIFRDGFDIQRYATFIRSYDGCILILKDGWLICDECSYFVRAYDGTHHLWCIILF